MRDLSPQQRSRSCFPFLSAIRSSIYRRRRHTVPWLIILLQNKQKVHQGINKFNFKYSAVFPKTHTHAFSGGFFSQKSIGSFRDLSKISSTLQHLLITSDWAIGSRDILVGSCVPSYLKAGCFQSWWGWTRRLTKEKTTWSPVIPLFFKWAMAFRMQSTCSPPGPLLDQFSWTWGALEILSRRGDSKFPTWNQNFFHSTPLPAGS